MAAEDIIISEIRDLAKKPLDKKKLKTIIIQTGKEMDVVSAHAGDISFAMRDMFSEENMRALFAELQNQGPFRWPQAIKLNLIRKCQQLRLDKVEAYKAITTFMEAFLNNMSMEFPELVQLMQGRLLEEKLSQMQEEFSDVLGQQSARTSAESWQSAMFEDLETDISYEECEEQETPKWQSIPVNDTEVEWKLAHHHVEGIFERNDTSKWAEDIRALTALWKQERDAYPNWYIVPYKVSEELCYKTRDYGLLFHPEVCCEEEMLVFAFEYMWRHEIGMLIVDTTTVNQIRTIWEAYESTQPDMECAACSTEWYCLGLFLMRQYREVFCWEEWQDICEQLEAHEKLDAREGDELWFERLQMYYAKLDLRTVQNEIDSHPLEDDRYEIRFRVAAIQLQCGKVEAAEDILTKLGNQLERALGNGNNAQSDNVHYCSLLACCSRLDLFIKKGKRYRSLEEEKKTETEDALQGKMEAMRPYLDFKENLAVTEGEFLRCLYNEAERQKEPFAINRETKILMQTDTGYGMAGYYCYRFWERSGVPRENGNICYISKQMESYMNRYLLELCPAIGIRSLLMGSNKKMVEILINRSYLAGTDGETVTELLCYVLEVLRLNMHEFRYHNGWGKQDLYTSIMHNGAELVKRLSAKCLPGMKRELIDILLCFAEEDCLDEYGEMDRFIQEMGKYISEEEKAAALNDFMRASTKKRAASFGRDTQIDVTEILYKKEAALALYRGAKVDYRVLDSLLKKAERRTEERQVVLSRLVMLSYTVEWKPEQKERFAGILWSQVNEETDCPDMPDYYLYNFMKLPAPAEVPVCARIKKYLLKKEWIADFSDTGGTSCSFCFGHIRYFEELKRFSEVLEEKNFWNADARRQLCERMIAYWDLEKRRLQSTFDHRHVDIREEFVSRFRMLQRTMWSVLEHSEKKMPDEERTELTRLCKEMRESELPFYRLEMYLQIDDEKSVELPDLFDGLEVEENLSGLLDTVFFLATETCANRADLDEMIARLVELGYATNHAASAVYTIHNIFYSGKTEISDSMMRRICRLLRYLYVQTDYEKRKTEHDIKQAIAIRKSCVCLAFQMHRYHTDRGLSVPDEVERWHELCSEDEFNEVVNEWVVEE